MEALEGHRPVGLKRSLVTQHLLSQFSIFYHNSIIVAWFSNIKYIGFITISNKLTFRDKLDHWI